MKEVWIESDKSSVSHFITQALGLLFVHGQQTMQSQSTTSSSGRFDLLFLLSVCFGHFANNPIHMSVVHVYTQTNDTNLVPPYWSLL